MNYKTGHLILEAMGIGDIAESASTRGVFSVRSMDVLPNSRSFNRIKLACELVGMDLRGPFDRVHWNGSINDICYNLKKNEA